MNPLFPFLPGRPQGTYITITVPIDELQKVFDEIRNGTRPPEGVTVDDVLEGWFVIENLPLATLLS